MVVQDTGEVLWMPQAMLNSSCSFDTLYFPFDEQQCELKFGSWTYNGFKVSLRESVALPFSCSSSFLSVLVIPPPPRPAPLPPTTFVVRRP